MKIQVISDLYLNVNTSHPFIKVTDADVIVLAGDISGGFKAEADFATRLADKHDKKVIIVNGNHTFHNQNLYEVQKKWRNSKIPNVVYLDHTTGFILDDVNFLGGTLWIDYTKKTECWTFSNPVGNDFSSIRVSKTALFTPDISTHQNLLLLGHIEHNLSQSHKNVIITHHPPSYKCYPKGFADDPQNCHLANELEHFIKSNQGIDAWIHGHARKTVDYTISGTRLVCNPYGNESNEPSGLNKDFDNSFIIEV